MKLLWNWSWKFSQWGYSPRYKTIFKWLEKITLNYYQVHYQKVLNNVFEYNFYEIILSKYLEFWFKYIC